MNKAVECELCGGSPAKTYCESDGARLCWRCDAKVHGANFLVAKHSRALLCHHCQAQTTWAASGPKLAPSLSFCLSCLSHAFPKTQSSQLEAHHHDDDDDVSEFDSDVDDDDDQDQSISDDDEDGDNQVVPWASAPPLACGSEAEDDNNVNGGMLKRKREIAFLHSSYDDIVRL